MLKTLEGLKVEEILKIDFSGYDKETLKIFLEDIQEREFLNQMIDHWTYEDNIYDTNCHKLITIFKNLLAE